MYFVLRAAVLERMPVVQKNFQGQTSEEATDETIMEIQPTKVKQEEAVAVLPQHPANQVWW